MRRIFFMSLIVLLPFVTAAQEDAPNVNFAPIKSATYDLADLLRLFLPISFALAVLFFFWHAAMFVISLNQGDAVIAQKKRGLFIGIFVLFVMASIWGIVAFMQNILGVNGSDTLLPPGVNLPERDAGDVSL